MAPGLQEQEFRDDPCGPGALTRRYE